MRRFLLAAALGCLGVAKLRGQSAGHDLPRGFRSMAGVTLNLDSAATILAKLGATRMRPVRTADGEYAAWCYEFAERRPGGRGALLELMSEVGATGSPGRTLNVIRLRASAPAEDRRGCASLPASADPSTPAGLRLGLDTAHIRTLLGAPSRTSGDSATYYFNAKEYLRRDSPEYEIWNTPELRESCFDAGLPYANVRATITIVLRDGGAAEIRIERYDRTIC